MAKATPDAEQLVRDYVEMVNEREYSKIPDLVSESFVMHDPAAPAEEVPGPEREVHRPEGFETFIRGIVAGFPDFQVNVVNMLSSDDLVMYEAELTMTHGGGVRRDPSDGAGNRVSRDVLVPHCRRQNSGTPSLLRHARGLRTTRAN